MIRVQIVYLDLLICQITINYENKNDFAPEIDLYLSK